MLSSLMNSFCILIKQQNIVRHKGENEEQYLLGSLEIDS